jgi:uncharacterized protein (TIGR00255 family)
MTGYGRGCWQERGMMVEVEIKSVNHRFLDLHFRLPKALSSLEPSIRKKLKEGCYRGKLDFYVNITPVEEGFMKVHVDTALAVGMWRAMESLAQQFGREGDLHLSLLLSRPELWSVKEEDIDRKEIWPVVEKAIDEALSQLVEHRVREGESLKRQLVDSMICMEQCLQGIADRAPDLPKLYRDRLEKRLEDMHIDVSQDRLAQEAAIMADKVDVTEEIVRLRQHFKEFNVTLGDGSPCGKKLEFLLQEILREANTIASKCQDAGIAHLVVHLKNEIEKAREQVQNIE